MQLSRQSVTAGQTRTNLLIWRLSRSGPSAAATQNATRPERGTRFHIRERPVTWEPTYGIEP